MPYGPKYIVHWENYPVSQATWEPWEHLTPSTQEDIKQNPLFDHCPDNMQLDTLMSTIKSLVVNHGSSDLLFHK